MTTDSGTDECFNPVELDRLENVLTDCKRKKVHLTKWNLNLQHKLLEMEEEREDPTVNWYNRIPAWVWTTAIVITTGVFIGGGVVGYKLGKADK